MKIIKTASGKETIKISKNDWQSIGKRAGWMKQAEAKEEAPAVEYYIDKGKIYDEEGEDITNNMSILNAMMGIDYEKEGIGYKGKGIPRFRELEEANKFLAAIEKITGKPLGRVVEDVRRKLRVNRDTRKEKVQEQERSREERNKRIKETLMFEDPEEAKRKKEEVQKIEEREHQKAVLEDVILDKFERGF